MSQDSGLSIKIILKAFDEYSSVIFRSMIESLRHTLAEDTEAYVRLARKDFHNVLILEDLLYSALFFDFLLFQFKVSDEKAKFIFLALLKKICMDRDIKMEKLIEILKPREELFTSRVQSSPDHLGKNLHDLVSRVIYAYENSIISNTAVAITNDPVLEFRVFSSFQERYTGSLKSQSLNELLEDIKTKRIEEMA